MTLFGIEIPSPFHLHINPCTARKNTAGEEQVTTLARVSAGGRAVVTKYLPGMPAERYAQLRAYGLGPGCEVFVLQHTPITVIRIDHLELALEHCLVKEIQVTLLD
jgi:Fe2+ transport system protein FeoA